MLLLEPLARRILTHLDVATLILPIIDLNDELHCIIIIIVGITLVIMLVSTADQARETTADEP